MSGGVTVQIQYGEDFLPLRFGVSYQLGKPTTHLDFFLLRETSKTLGFNHLFGDFGSAVTH